MNALILAAGYGSRIKHITKKTPKCLIEVRKNHAIIDVWINKLLQSGIDKIFINTHYKANVVNKYISKKYGSRIKIFHEPKLLGTSKTVLKNKNQIFNTDCLILHADNFAPYINLKKIISYFFYSRETADVIILGFKTNDFRNSGILKTNKLKKLLQINEKLNFKTGNLANGGLYILSKKALKNFKKIKYNNLILDIFEQFKDKINVYKYNGVYFDIGTKKNLLKLKNFYK